MAQKWLNMVLVKCVVLILFLVGCEDKITNNYYTNNYFYGDSLYDPTIELEVLFTNPADSSRGPYYYYYEGIPYPYITIQFSKLLNIEKLNRKSVTLTVDDSDIRISLFDVNDGENEQSFDIEIPIMQNVLMYRTDNYIYRATKEYTVRIDTTIEDIHGYRLSEPYIFSYIPEPEFRPYKCYPPENPEDQYELINPIDPGQISIYFNSEITTDIFNNILISPTIIGSWKIKNNTDSMGVQYQIYDDLPNDTKYTISITSETEDKYGNVLNKQYTYNIKTQPFNGYHSGASYHTGPNGFEVCYRVSFSFNGYLDTLTVNPALAISPNLTSSITFNKDSNDRCHNFQVEMVESEMLANTSYTIEIDTTLKTEKGINLATPCTFSFTTGQ